MKIGLVSSLATAGLVLAHAALAQTPTSARSTVTTSDYTDQRVEGDQIVTFRDDALAGDTDSAYGFTLRRPPGILRQGLIRPRVNFVSELLKSVENL